MRILRGLRSRLLPCGCIAGIYETYDGETVSLLDDRGQACTHADHQPGNPVTELTGLRPSEVTLDANRHGKT
jgi:hypothetical protein